MQVASSGSSGEQSVTVFESVRTTFIAVSMSQYGERTGRTPPSAVGITPRDEDPQLPDATTASSASARPPARRTRATTAARCPESLLRTSSRHHLFINHYRDGDRSFLGARQWFDLISTVFP
jgi:hypothetical protein